MALPWMGVKPLREWSDRARAVLVLGLATVVALVVIGIATTDTGPSETERRNYERKRSICTAVADGRSLVGRQRADAINNCLLN